MKSVIEMIREKIKEWSHLPYLYQTFNKDESPEWRPLLYIPPHLASQLLEEFYERCEEYKSFKFSIEAGVVGAVKPCSYSELQKITEFKPGNLIRKTLSGRLFHGSIVEGSKTRPAIVKTWDLLLPERNFHAQRPSKFCDEIELFTDEKANMHQNLVKLHSYCYETRLAAVYDIKFTKVLSDVLLDDKFGWDDRIKVATQVADLFAWLHKKRIAVGSVTGSCIMIDEEVKIHVFDFGYVSNHVDEDSKIPLEACPGFDAPEAGGGERTMKSDVYVFGLLLVDLITKQKVDFRKGPLYVEEAIRREANGKNCLVPECFEVDRQIALEVTRLVKACTEFYPDKRPAMNDVLEDLTALMKGEIRGEKRKREDDVLPAFSSVELMNSSGRCEAACL